MREISHYAVAALTLGGSAAAQSSQNPYYPPYAPPAQSSVYNQSSVYLPTPPIVQGQDMVRGASGVTCQTAVASGGAYLDIGLIGSQDVFDRDTAALYGRVVVPLGERPKRPDCTKLYAMEIERMRMEIELLRMGLPPGALATQRAPAAEVAPPVAPSAAPNSSPVIVGGDSADSAPPPTPSHKPARASRELDYSDAGVIDVSYVAMLRE